MLLFRPYFESTENTKEPYLDWIKYIFKQPDASGRLARCDLPVADFDFDVAQRAGVKRRAADALPELPTKGDESIDLDDDVLVCNSNNTQVTNGETLFGPVCTECDAERDVIADKHDEDCTELEEKSVGAVQPSELQTARDKVPTLVELSFENLKDAYCCKETTGVELSSSRFHIVHSSLLHPISNIDSCLYERVPVTLREPIFHAKHISRICSHSAERRMYGTMHENFFFLAHGQGSLSDGKKMCKMRA